MDTYVVDTNALLDAFLKRETATEIQSILEKAQQSSCVIWMPQIVIFEVAWVLASFYKKDKQYIVQLLRTLLEIDTVMTENKDGILSALDLFASKSGLSLSDAYIITFALHKNPKQLITGDETLYQIYKKKMQKLL